MSAIEGLSTDTRVRATGLEIGRGLIGTNQEASTQDVVITANGGIYAHVKPGRNFDALKQYSIDAVPNKKPPTIRKFLASLDAKKIPHDLLPQYKWLMLMHKRNVGFSSAAGKAAQEKNARKFLYTLHSRLPNNSPMKNEIAECLFFNSPKNKPLPSHMRLRGLSPRGNLAALKHNGSGVINLNTQNNHIFAEMLYAWYLRERMALHPNSIIGPLPNAPARNDSTRPTGKKRPEIAGPGFAA